MGNLINLQNMFVGIGVGFVVIIITRLIGKKFWVQIIAALVSFVIGFGISHFHFTPAVIVPDVTGSYRVVGEHMIREKGFKLNVIEEDHPEIDPLKIIKQKPKGGSLVKEGSLVTIVVSKETELPIKQKRSEQYAETESDKEAVSIEFIDNIIYAKNTSKAPVAIRIAFDKTDTYGTGKGNSEINNHVMPGDKLEREIRNHNSVQVWAWGISGSLVFAKNIELLNDKAILLKHKVILTEMGKEKEKMVLRWFEDYNSGFSDLAKKVLAILEGRQPKGNKVPLDVIMGRYREVMGKRSSEYIPPPYALEEIKKAYVIAWKERNAQIPEWENYNLDDIAPLPRMMVNINVPADGDVVGFRNTIRGTFSDVQYNQDIWVVVYPHPVPRYHPQTVPARRTPDGNWQATAYVGPGPHADIGVKFDIIAVVADKKASKVLADYLSAAARAGDWPGLDELPPGVQIMDKIIVTRREG